MADSLDLSLTVSKVIADLWERYLAMVDDNISDGEAMDKLGLHRYCCRRMIMTHVDLIEKVLRYVTLRFKLYGVLCGLGRQRP